MFSCTGFQNLSHILKLGLVGHTAISLASCAAAESDRRPSGTMSDAAPMPTLDAQDVPPPAPQLLATYVGDAQCNDNDFGEPLRITTALAWNTDADCDAVVSQSDGPEICVVKRKAISVAGNGKMRVRGSRALALFAADAIEVDGTIDAAATGAEPGPGAFLGQVVQGKRAMREVSGGGGGGGATAGADGGYHEYRRFLEDTAVRYDGGAAGQRSETRELVGGGGGGASGNGEGGGGGGGAVALIGCTRVTLGSTSKLLLGGGGGQTVQRNGLAYCVGGSGGGAGGTLVIESPLVEIARGAGMFANGGSGANGATQERNGCTPMSSGTDALNTTAPATAERGGAGGARDAAPTAGFRGRQVLTDISATGGGGGGAVGRIRILRGRGVDLDIAEISASPMPSLGFVVMR